MFKNILVLECPWDKEKIESISVWPFISEFANVMGINAYYHVFSDKRSFERWVDVYNKSKLPGKKLLYIASHGTRRTIAEGLKRSTILPILKKAKGIEYLHFGTCSFGNDINLKDILKTCKHVNWVAGYQNSVDWIDSTLFDMLFWRATNFNDDPNAKGKKIHTLTKVFTEKSKLSEELSFNFCWRRGNNIKTINE